MLLLLLLLLLLLMVVVMVLGGVEHVPVVGYGRGGRVLRAVSEGEHVEGGGGRTVQHPAGRGS